MIHIDGSAGEGGGQILRTALGLSLISGRPFHITNIRARRKKPGLMRQHLTAVQAAVEVGNGQAKGGSIGSTDLIFTPGDVQPGNFRFSIGTAGSCTLVLQTVLPALITAKGSSSVILEGGTHNPMAPPYDFLATSFLPVLKEMGVDITAELVRPGFFPAGGGEFRLLIKPATLLKPFYLQTRTVSHLSAKAVCAQLPRHIAEREMRVVKNRLEIADEQLEIVRLEKYGPGNVISIFVHCDELTETFTGFGQKNVKAETVASRTVRQVKDYLKSEAPVGRYLADQLLIPMALAGTGSFLTGKPTNHTLTNIETVQRFLDVAFQISQVSESAWEISL